MNTRDRILNLGCGADYREEMVNIDYFAERVDVRHDLNLIPYPFDDDTFDEIRCMNIIEHLNDVVAVMGELHRIARNGARITIRVPHFRSACLYEDITHRHGFAWRTMDVFTDDSSVYGEYSNARYRIIDRRYTPYKIPALYNLLSRAPVLTDNFLSKFIPMASISFILVAIKNTAASLSDIQ